MDDPLEFARAHVRARSLCSEFVVDWLRSRGVEVGVDPREQLRFWLKDGTLSATESIGEQLGVAEISPLLARDGDVAVVTLPNGEQALGVMRSGCVVTAASGHVAVYSEGIVKTWGID